ncbi:MAG: Flagellar biosynthesis protein FlhF [Schlesneria sp.]|nr:Flagellar biosynthesis protein FlhF [Schlesneria sp.]
MSNTVRTFRAATADEALAQVRREMGLDAVIVEVKQVAKAGLFSWLSAKPQVEVKAQRSTIVPRARLIAEMGKVAVPIDTSTVAAASVKRTSVADTAKREQESIGGFDWTPSAFAAMPPAPQLEELAPPPSLLSTTRTPVNRVGLVEQQRATNSRPLSSTPGRDLPVIDLDLTSPTSIEKRLDALQQMIADLSRRSTRGLVEIPPELFPHYLSLVEADVADDVARELVQQLSRHATSGQLAETSATTALLTALIERQIPCRHAITPVTGRRQIAMMVGPTGVGKTTTLAKLAGRFGLQQDCRLGLITVDTYRVAAVEQLRTYAEIIDLPMRIVTSPAEMQDALDAFADCDLVLIDTAGRSPHDDRRLAELKELIAVAKPDHVYLVLSLASGASSLRAAADRFAAVSPTAVVFTKLDETAGCGGLLSASREIGLPISYFATGQEVPRDIEPADSCRAARLIMGLDTVNCTNH